MKTLPGWRQAKKPLRIYNRMSSDNLNRVRKNNLRMLIKFRTGHWRFERHLNNKMIVEESNCKL